MSMGMRLLLVDAHPVVRLGLMTLLRDALHQEVEIHEVASGEDALHQVSKSIPHLTLMEIGLPGISGIETARRLRQRLPQFKVLFVTRHSGLALVRKALDVGALGYVNKTAEPGVLVEAVQRCLAGHPYIEQSLAIQLVCQRGGEVGTDTCVLDLTPRELEIFIMLAKGFAVRKIADHLCISHKTVSNHVSLLKHKLGQDSLAGLVHLALESGVVASGSGHPAASIPMWTDTALEHDPQVQEMLVQDAGI